jgi:hypothetical protein
MAITGSMTAPILKRAFASRPSGQWKHEDYDVLADGKIVGRILEEGSRFGPPELRGHVRYSSILIARAAAIGSSSGVTATAAATSPCSMGRWSNSERASISARSRPGGSRCCGKSNDQARPQTRLGLPLVATEWGAVEAAAAEGG